MKKFILHTVLFLLPILAVVVACEVLVRQIPNDYSYKYDWLEKNAHRVQVLTLGTSHALNGINPSLFSLKTFNTAYHSQDIERDHYLFMKNIDKMDSLRYLILPMSLFTLNNNNEDNQRSWHYLHNYILYYHQPKTSLRIEYYLEVYQGIPFVRLYNWFCLHKDEITCDSLGFSIDRRAKERPKDIKWDDVGKEKAEEHTGRPLNTTRIAKNKTLIEEMVETCRAKGVTVILLTTPTHEAYRRHVAPEYEPLKNAYCEELVRRYNNVRYIDLLASTEYTEEDFWDVDHLNVDIGATKLSKMLDAYIVADMEKQKRQAKESGTMDAQ